MCLKKVIPIGVTVPCTKISQAVLTTALLQVPQVPLAFLAAALLLSELFLVLQLSPLVADPTPSFLPGWHHLEPLMTQSNSMADPLPSLPPPPRHPGAAPPHPEPPAPPAPPRPAGAARDLCSRAPSGAATAAGRAVRPSAARRCRPRLRGPSSVPNACGTEKVAMSSGVRTGDGGCVEGRDATRDAASAKPAQLEAAQQITLCCAKL